MSNAVCGSDCQLNSSRNGVGLLLGPSGFHSNSQWLFGGAALLDSAGTIIFANESVGVWLGFDAADLPGKSLPELLGRRHPEWGASLMAFLKPGLPMDRVELSSADSADKLKIEAFRRNDEVFLRLDSGIPHAQELEGLFPEPCYGRLIGHQILQRTLRSEAQVENLMNRWPGILFSQRPDFSFEFVSPKIEELTGVPALEWQRQCNRFWEVVHEADLKLVEARLRAEAQTGAGFASTFRIRHIRTGQVTYLWEQRRAIRSGNGLLLGYEGMWLDVTRQTIAERRLLHMSWRENMGALTAGMAHDFCNIMTGIVGLSEAFAADLTGDSPLREGLGLIRNTAFQAGQMAHRIRHLHQGLTGEKRFQDINEAVRGLMDVLQKVMPRRVRIQTALDSGQLPLFVDAVELQHVIVNLSLNAVDAMPKGGDLILRTVRYAERPEAQLIDGIMPRAPVICFSVQDTGTGIPKRLLKSILDPFFTTKPLGKGSGLGLYNARLFAEKHGAAISVETAEGVGTTFHLWFPEADFTETQQPRASEVPGRHTLLVTGSQGPALDQLVSMLRQNGYYVVPASGEAEAEEALHAPNFQFTGLVLLNSGQPPGTLPLLGRSGPQLKTILTLFGCNQDELPSDLISSVTAVIPFDLPPGEFLSQLKTVLQDASVIPQANAFSIM